MRIHRLLVAVLAVALAALPALAQEAAAIPNAPKSSRLAAMLITLGLIAGIGVASFMTPKRGHQD